MAFVSFEADAQLVAAQKSGIVDAILTPILIY